MPRIIVEADDSAREVVFWERVGTEDFDADHFRRCLCDRIAWAVADAQAAAEQPLQLAAPDEPDDECFSRDPDPDLVHA
jgi:hypothetical protein